MFVIELRDLHKLFSIGKTYINKQKDKNNLCTNNYLKSYMIRKCEY